MALEVEAASGWLRGRLQWRRRWKWRRRWRWRWPPLVSPSLAPARSARDRLRVASPRQRPLCSAEAGEEVRCAARRRRGARRAATRRVDTQSYGLLRAANSSESLAPRPMPSRASDQLANEPFRYPTAPRSHASLLRSATARGDCGSDQHCCPERAWCVVALSMFDVYSINHGQESALDGRVRTQHSSARTARKRFCIIMYDTVYSCNQPITYLQAVRN